VGWICRRHTLFMPIRACSDVDSEGSYRLNDSTDTERSNPSPNESHDSDSALRSQIEQSRQRLEDTSHDSLVQPLTCVSHALFHCRREAH
jgi:hypothetical protein